MIIKCDKEKECLYLNECCPICNKTTTIVITKNNVSNINELMNYLLTPRIKRKPIQDTFPSMDIKLREFIISGICFDCQDIIFD